jgi:hypothetical protein
VSGPDCAALRAIVADELAAPADPAVAAVAWAARAAHGPGVCAVLFYGSCRRDGYRDGLLVDLYLIVDDYRSVHRSRLMRWLNRLLPPNVYYVEAPYGCGRVRAKFALVSLGQLERLVRPATLNPYFWARFAQPTGLLWARDGQVATAVAAALVQSILTTEAAVRPLVGAGADAVTLWGRALTESYRTELRAEKPQRAALIVAGDLERYRRVTAALGTRAPAVTAAAARRRWFWRRVQGKALSLLRLAKASWTFAGGADYLAWKISRHAGIPVEFSPWERRHPLLAAPLVLWRLARRGAIR